MTEFVKFFRFKNWAWFLAAVLFPGCATTPAPKLVMPAAEQAVEMPVEAEAPNSGDYHLPHSTAAGHVRLAFVGDINLSRRIETLIDQRGKKWVLAACKPVFDKADLAVANLESPVGVGGSAYAQKSVYLKGRPDCLDALSYGGIGLVTLANNHILDFGPEVMNQTVDGLEKRGILYTGLVRPGDGRDRAVYVRYHGVRLAFLGYCSVCPREFAPGPGRAGVDVAMVRVMAPEVRRAKAKADFVIVLVHWGTEYFGTNPLQEKLAQALKEAGADVVIGAHPHVLQRVEWIDKTLVAYSLGNFLFDLQAPICRDSCILLVDLEKGKAPECKAVPVATVSDRPVPIETNTAQARRIIYILKNGFEYNGRKIWKKPVPFS
jgi:poly-gamma-glutamate capsule biosynthesis protein CapA/YwtB (metallophosphatase superfamily)